MGIAVTNKWDLPSYRDGNAWMVRSDRAEKDLRNALDMLEMVKDNIPQNPASVTKGSIENFLRIFKK